MLNRKFWLSAAATAVLAACGETSTTDAGSTCTSDAACGTGKVCHPLLKQCITSCKDSTDCPSSAKTCKRFDGTAGSATTPGFCQCSTNELCNTGGSTTQVCSTATLRCEAKCTSTSCPSGYTCDTGSGQCKGGGSDAGTDAGVDAGTMDAGVACSTTNQQPDTCGYGGACFTDMKCGDAANDVACPNIAQAITAGNYTAWNRATGTGPVIYVHVDEADAAADCDATAPNAFTVTLYAYAGNSLFPDNKSNLPGFWYFTSTGAKIDVTTLLRPSNYLLSTDKKAMSAKFSLCAASTVTALQAGFAFTGGNAYCANLTR